MADHNLAFYRQQILANAHIIFKKKKNIDVITLVHKLEDKPGSGEKKVTYEACLVEVGPFECSADGCRLIMPASDECDSLEEAFQSLFTDVSRAMALRLGTQWPPYPGYRYDDFRLIDFEHIWDLSHKEAMLLGYEPGHHPNETITSEWV